MDYKNLKLAWICLLVDNVPPQVRPSDSEFDAVLARLREEHGEAKLARIEGELFLCRAHEDPEDEIADIEGRFWQAATGGADSGGESEISEEANELLEFMFDNLLS
jgi:hypothetical protein